MSNLPYLLPFCTMLAEAPHKQLVTREPAHPSEVSSSVRVQQLAQSAEINPGGSEGRLLASMAIGATKSMNSVVFGKQTKPFSEAMRLARDWSAGEDVDLNKLHRYWQSFGQQAFIKASSAGNQSNERNPIHDPIVQAHYVTGSLMLYILYQDPSYHGIHPTKPEWHARIGANSLASIITSEAAEVMSRNDNSKDHQHDIDTLVEKEFTNW